MSADLTGRRIVVTGASGGLGAAVVRELLAGGARVVAVGRSEPGLAGLRKKLGALAADGAFETCVADVGESAGAALAMDGELDGLVHVAGGWAGGHPICDAPDGELDAMLDANLRSTWFALRAALRAMRGRGGRVVLVASTGGLGAAPNAAAYGASKAAVVSLVQSVAVEARALGVAVNAVAPGTIATEANRFAMPGADTSAWVTPAEVARTIAFLVSPAAAGVSGATVPVTRS